MKSNKNDYVITQNGKSVLSSNSSLMVIWKNLTGKNIQGKKYREYVEWALRNGFEKGEIQYTEKGIVKNKFIIV